MENFARPQITDVSVRSTASSSALAAPTLTPLLRDAARILGLDADDSAWVAQIGAFELDGMIVSVIPLEPDDANSDCDVALVSPLIGVFAHTLEQMRMLLEANLLLTTIGCVVGSTGQGELHLVYPIRMTALNAPALARKLGKVAAIAAALRSELTGNPASPANAGGSTSVQTGRRTA
jgi:hypothetical protein